MYRRIFLAACMVLFSVWHAAAFDYDSYDYDCFFMRSEPASLPLGLLAKLLPKKWRPGYKDAQRKKRHDDILRSY
ncbi:MAG: hypothetical protein IIT45_09155 [Treponema sp.]|nr:hypothetical protein [Treponema sp.]